MEMRISPFRIPSKALKTFLSYFVSYLFCSPLDMALNFFVLCHCWGKKVFFFEIPYLRCSWKSCELFLLKSSQIYRGIVVFFLINQLGNYKASKFEQTCLQVNCDFSLGDLNRIKILPSSSFHTVGKFSSEAQLSCFLLLLLLKTRNTRCTYFS